MKTCAICNNKFPSWVKIDGKSRNLQRRKYCLVCSPWGEHNTLTLHLPKRDIPAREKGGTYKYQKVRGVKRKRELVLIRGGKCEICGYSTNLGALEFHHKEPNNKISELDVRVITNRTWEFLITELDKCLLLCANCHREHHNPDLNDWKKVGEVGVAPTISSVMSRVI